MNCNSFEGSCHCGAIGFSFRPHVGPEAWHIHACQCTFCRKHGARTTSDPRGRVSFHINDERQLQRYRFALRTADFLVCRACGVYIAAVLTSARGQFATVNVNTMRALAVANPAPTSYDAESSEERQQRRERQWTPVVAADDKAVSVL